MNPHPPRTGIFEASPWRLAPREAGPRSAQRGLDRASPMRRQEKRRKERVGRLMEVLRLGEGRPPPEEGSPP